MRVSAQRHHTVYEHFSKPQTMCYLCPAERLSDTVPPLVWSIRVFNKWLLPHCQPHRGQGAGARRECGPTARSCSTGRDKQIPPQGIKHGFYLPPSPLHYSPSAVNCLSNSRRLRDEAERLVFVLYLHLQRLRFNSRGYKACGIDLAEEARALTPGIIACWR